jgi:hypothetical protein
MLWTLLVPSTDHEIGTMFTASGRDIDGIITLEPEDAVTGCWVGGAALQQQMHRHSTD